MTITILEEKDPEVLAMLQAFYSRSLEPIRTRMEKLTEDGNSVDGLKKKLNQYYVGYGHSSIGDCGYVTIFIEGYSILAIKALQNTPLYVGQESSTRYISLSGDVYAPDSKSKDVQLGWLELYAHAKENLIEAISLENPKPDHVTQAVYDKTVQARALDIARSLIPCGAKSNTSWTTSLRKLHEHTVYLLGHPLQEVRDMARQIRYLAMQNFPSSMPNVREPQIEWLRRHPELYYTSDTYSETGTRIEIWKTSPDIFDLLKCLEDRPERTDIPAGFAHSILVALAGNMDFGTWRDLQRHRPNSMRPFLVEARKGFHKWYKQQFTKYLGSDVSNTVWLRSMKNVCFEDDEKYNAQYSCPMGIQGSYMMTMGLPEAIYITELRTNRTVHPILREVAIALGHEIKNALKPNSPLFIDEEPDGLHFKRGTQDIMKKDEA